MDFANLKNIVNGLVDNVTTKSREVAGTAADKAKSAARIAKLTLELNGEKESLKKTFSVLGQTYYENKDQQPDALLAQLCEEVDSTKERIAAIEAEIAQLKSELGPKEADVEVSFEEVVDEAEQEAAPAECGEEKCCEAPAEDEGISVDEVINKVEDVIDDLKEKVEDAIDELKGEDD